MKTGKLILIAILIIIISTGIYFVLRPELNSVLPTCKYGPTDAVLNEPCLQGEFHP